MRDRYINQKILLHKLQNDPLVKSVKITCDIFTIKYVTGITEKWLRNETFRIQRYYFIPDDPLQGTDVRIAEQYPTFIFDDNSKKHLFLISNDKWRKASFYEQRLSIQRLLKRIIDEGWVDINYPNEALIKDLKRLSSFSYNKHCKNNAVVVHSKYNHYYPGRLLIESLANWDVSFSKFWNQPNLLYRTILKLLKRGLDITRHTLLVQLSRNRESDIFICPNVYRTIFNKFGIENMSILDPYPDNGSKAIAATIENCRYNCNIDKFSKLGKFLGADFNTDDEFDCVLLDSSFTCLLDLNQWFDKASIKLIYVPRNCADKLPKPNKKIDILTGVAARESDFIYYYI